MSRLSPHEQSYEEFGRAEGEEFYNSVQRLIRHFQTLDTKDSPQGTGGRGFQRGRATNRSGVYYGYDEDPVEENSHNRKGLWNNKLERSKSLGRLGEDGAYRVTPDRDYSREQRIGAYIAFNDNDVEDEKTDQKASAFVRGSKTRRTFSGVTRRKNIDAADHFDDSRSDNYRLVSHSQYISSPLPEDSSPRDLVTSPKSSRRFIRNSPKLSSTRSVERRSSSVPRERLPEHDHLKRNELRSSIRQNKEQKQVEYVQSSGEKCFPFKKKKSHHHHSKSSKVKGQYNPIPRGAYSDYDESYVSEDSVFDTGYDSSASAGYNQRHSQKLYGHLPRHVNMKDKYSTGRLAANYEAVEDAGNSYNDVGQEPQVHMTKEGYKMLELDVNVSGFRPEDIQIVTQGKFLQVIAKGVVVQRGGQGDSRIYRELKRQFTLPEVANAEYLQGILSPEGVLHITGPVGVSTLNTKKLKRKRVKFHID